MFVYRQKSDSPFDRVNMSVPVSGMALKYGFQWLNKRNAVDAVVVDEKTNASVLEHLVFMYDLLTLSLYTVYDLLTLSLYTV